MQFNNYLNHNIFKNSKLFYNCSGILPAYHKCQSRYSHLPAYLFLPCWEVYEHGMILTSFENFFFNLFPHFQFLKSYYLSKYSSKDLEKVNQKWNLLKNLLFLNFQIRDFQDSLLILLAFAENNCCQIQSNKLESFSLLFQFCCLKSSPIDGYHMGQLWFDLLMIMYLVELIFLLFFS